jgi:hypothetical protein
MKKAISIQTTLAWVIYAVFVIALISLSSCGSTRHMSSYQDHLRTTHNRNFVVVDNGGCGWNN